METLIIIGAILIVLGIIGSITPVLPGPVLAYIGLVILYFAKPGTITIWPLVVFGLAMLVLTAIDYLAPLMGAKLSGASRKGLIGCIAGSLMGILFFPPLGIFIGALLGAFVGEIIAGKDPEAAVKAGIGTIFGSLTVIILQTIFSLTVAVYFLVKLF